MNPIKRNIPVFGPERRSFLEVIKQYSDTKAAYDGAIYAYGNMNYGTRLLDNLGGTLPVRHNISYNDLMQTFDLDGNAEALGMEFEFPLRKGYKVNLLAELWNWDYTERLASTAVDNVYYKGPDDQSAHDLFVNPDEDEYVYLSLVLNHEQETDFDQTETFLQNKILRYIQDRSPVTNRLFVIRVKQIVWSAESELGDILKNFDVRDDSVILEILD